ncbi:squalene synthase HpnC [Ramlibacter montanisoli]|uniref:Squalene synthase HpnC n=1 Tax=Ramlibacter montanisoli TaxID=2732512 RepID=A0A849K525_9BURK|nr:squalene synthase HpnC [Ramlibacter montanisoli]NNU43512.1 squalene synthase HpnC [Ramlibacter montanisoli]
MSAFPDDRYRPVEHYENFPVASWLCPPRLRRPIAAIYWFARTADDIADEGNATEGERLADLLTYRNELAACLAGNSGSGRWGNLFAALGTARVEFALPEQPLFDLLAAFRQDVEKTRDRAGYRDRADLVDYCSRSANPVGRLLLHLYGVTDAKSLAQSDAICTALQLANFWQDLSVDLPRGRYYLPAEDCRRHGLDPSRPRSWPMNPNAPQLVRELCTWTRDLMLSGAPLVHRVPGRAGWELRMVVQGGLRVLRRIEAMGHRTMQRRPALGPLDVPTMLWGALWM